ncbi:MAG TPA: glycerol-3-phosphate dehydrogenase/oxidase [Anaerolineae bacterium]|nr:glycerol-3-phosphate dehydrogenase/oxidase [Anaerolineae bacterium]
MWERGWREAVWESIQEPWDLIVVGGGITGAGILREATRVGLRCLLVERRDFGWGTSSRSSKLVHGGLRYLKEGKIGLTWASVHERERLLREGPGLIDPLGFLLATYRGDRPGRWTYSAGLTVYDLLALHWGHRHFSAEDFRLLAPHISRDGLQGGFRYGDAQTDDARLVLRVIQEAVAAGGTALSYAEATGLLVDGAPEDPTVVGVHLRDSVLRQEADVRGGAVISATGVWADSLRGLVGGRPAIRPLRGSHLIFPSWRFPVAQAVSFLHPFDRRPVFIFPWEGITLVGTTDVDHCESLDSEPSIRPEEVAYLMAAVDAQFGALRISLDDVISTFAGIRPVVGSGNVDPSKESRDHVVWEEKGLLTVTGGKLTTFRLIALDALRALRHRFPNMQSLDDKASVLNPVHGAFATPESLDDATRCRLLGRYSTCAHKVLEAALPGETAFIPGTQYLWVELRWAARAEGVVHLDDLLLRRVRIGHLLPRGAEGLLSRIREVCQPELGWDDARWEEEEAAYLALWRTHYSLPDRDTIPDWRDLPAAELAQTRRSSPLVINRHGRPASVVLLLALSALVIATAWRRRRQSARRHLRG